ncbi:hypothetical protein BH10CYA1_BH10CYA1_48400 [soil metagenome]
MNSFELASKPTTNIEQTALSFSDIHRQAGSNADHFKSNEKSNEGKHSEFSKTSDSIGLSPEQKRTGERILSTIEQGSLEDLKKIMQSAEKNPNELAPTLYAVSEELKTKGLSVSYKKEPFWGAGNETASNFGSLTIEGNGVSLNITTASKAFDSAQDIGTISNGYGKSITPKEAFDRIQNGIAPLF